MFSIDQNSHSLWDVLPKLQALIAQGRSVTHFVEDIDVAFTSTGAVGADGGLRLAREQYHRGGVADWGAGLFYSEFLGRLPTDIRDWEQYTGMKTSVLARKLGCQVEDLYNEFAVADNWQLIGQSYVGDRSHHRVIGDLTVRQTAEFVREILAKARADCMKSFPGSDSQSRLSRWFDHEQELVDRLLAERSQGRLVDLYRDWLDAHLAGRVDIQLTSSLFATDGPADRTALLEAFLADYDLASGLYNQAIAEAGVGLRPLDTGRGELPFFATMTYQGHLVRTAVHLDGNDIRLAERSYPLPARGKLPLERMAADGVRALAGKALILVMQVRTGRDGQELALPHRGSPYMPAAHLLAAKLEAAGMLPAGLRPIVRVRFHMLDRMRGLATIIRLPEHLRWYFGRDEVTANELAENHAELARQATRRLEGFKTAESRSQWLRRTWPEVLDEIETLEHKRRTLAARDPKSDAIRELGKRQKQLDVKLLRELLKRISQDSQSAELDYWDSRGALLPWCIALGGESLYNSVISQAELCRQEHTSCPE